MAASRRSMRPSGHRRPASISCFTTATCAWAVASSRPRRSQQRPWPRHPRLRESALPESLGASLPAAPKRIHPYERFGVFLFELMPCGKVGMRTAIWKHLPETIPRGRRAFEVEKLQTQLFQAIGDAGQRELMLLDVHDHVAASVEREEVARRHDLLCRMPVRKAHDGVPTVAGSFRSQRE